MKKMAIRFSFLNGWLYIIQVAIKKVVENIPGKLPVMETDAEA